MRFVCHPKILHKYCFRFLLDPDLSALMFGLTEFSFNKMLDTSIAQEKHDKTTMV